MTGQVWRVSALFTVALSLATAQSPFEPERPLPQDSLRFRSPLPQFTAKDLTDRVWATRDLKGVYTLVYIWMTPCARCGAQLSELEQIQDFYNIHRLKSDFQVMTFNIDRDLDHARQFTKDHGYSFPVVPDNALVQTLFPLDRDIPGEWVIDRDGLRSDTFRTWSLGRVLTETEKLLRQLE